MSQETAPAAEPQPAPTEAAKPEPVLATTPESRRSAALAAIQALEKPGAAPEQPAEEAAPEASAETAEPAAEPTEEKAEKQPKVTSLMAKLAKQDKELQQLKSRLKGSIALDELKQNPLKSLEAVGYGPQQVLDLWLGTPSGTPPAAPKEGEATADGKAPPSELVKLVQEQQRQLSAITQALQAKEQAERERAQADLYRNELSNVHGAVTGGGERWEMISARRAEPGLANNGGGAYDLAVETAQAIYRKRLESLGPRPSRDEIAEAAPEWEEVLDLVEKALVEDWQSRSGPVGKVKKLQPAPAAPAPAKHARKSLPSQPAAETIRRPADLSQDERRKRALAAIEALERGG